MHVFHEAAAKHVDCRSGGFVRSHDEFLSNNPPHLHTRTRIEGNFQPDLLRGNLVPLHVAPMPPCPQKKLRFYLLCIPLAHPCCLTQTPPPKRADSTSFHSMHLPLNPPFCAQSPYLNHKVSPSIVHRPLKHPSSNFSKSHSHIPPPPPFPQRRESISHHHHTRKPPSIRPPALQIPISGQQDQMALNPSTGARASSAPSPPTPKNRPADR